MRSERRHRGIRLVSGSFGPGPGFPDGKVGRRRRDHQQREKLAEASPGKPPSDAEAREFAKSFEKSVMSGDAAGIRAAVERAGRHAAGDGGAQSFGSGADRGRDGRGYGGERPSRGLSRLGPPRSERGGHFRLLHLHQKDGQQRALFRLVRPSGEVTYHDCILLRHADGKVRIDDAYLFAAGEMFSEGMHRELAASLAKGAIVLWPKGRPATVENDYATCADKLAGMKRRIEEGKFREALDIYQDLPDRFKTEKYVLLARLQAARA